MKCTNCGAEINDNAVVCQFCGKEVAKTVQAQPAGKSEKKWLTTFLLCAFFGHFGAHRFYAGHKGTAILMLLTFGCCGVLTLFDLYKIISNQFEDAEGKVISKDNKAWANTFMLCLYFGHLGAHRFYNGMKGSAILMLLTLGCCGWMTLYDLYRLLTDKFTDAEGNVITRN